MAASAFCVRFTCGSDLTGPPMNGAPVMSRVGCLPTYTLSKHCRICNSIKATAFSPLAATVLHIFTHAPTSSSICLQQKQTTSTLRNMCIKAAPATVYRKCGHRSEGVEKIYPCASAPNGPTCKNPPFNHSISDNRVNKWCDDCVAAGKGTN
ncbi:hypothetical protein BFJ63_vAg16542 [Fusarium oxysporum f. sp. narcissi]|uniref:Uncharacterized protein n=1 Tax=Fusarium oxysporum f. sp. narcissi TaxID=451672 RepID=A0A4Q2V785_FUSOX|nr:hypothetical protein BFJ63_vAg16542 [Fusarium oxysporum f. sp. narcissi]